MIDDPAGAAHTPHLGIAVMLALADPAEHQPFALASASSCLLHQSGVGLPGWVFEYV